MGWWRSFYFHRGTMHKLSTAIVKTDGKGKPVTAAMLGLTLRQTLNALRGGTGHTRTGITKNKAQPRNKARARMAKASRRINRV
jgi:hypothetical protein